MTDIAVHPEFAANGGFGHLRLGRNAPPEPAKLALDPYVGLGYTAPPAEVDFYSDVPSWPMYGNDRLGDCTCASAGHMVEAWSKAAGVEKVPTLADVEHAYWETGTPPSATGEAGGPTDDGRYETRVLSYWRKQARGTLDTIIGYAQVNAHNLDRVKFTVA